MKGCSLSNEILLHIQQLLAELEKDEDNILYTHIWLQANALFAFHYNLFGNIEKKIFKRLLDINKKVIE